MSSIRLQELCRLERHAQVAVVQRHGEAGGAREVVRIDVEFDLDTVREMPGGLIEQHVATRREEQAIVAREEETARLRQQLAAVEGGCRIVGVASLQAGL